MSNIGNAYFFNPMYLQAICGNRPLSTITMCLLHESGLIQVGSILDCYYREGRGVSSG